MSIEKMSLDAVVNSAVSTHCQDIVVYLINKVSD